MLGSSGKSSEDMQLLTLSSVSSSSANLLSMEPPSSPATTSKRERRQSPASFGCPLDEPLLSPSSSLSGDATFEPTIDMMVNDFDDEQTLNEEENLANLEAQNPEEEIATLKEESEMPLEMLLAKYGNMPPIEQSVTTHKRNKKQATTKRRKVERQPKSGEPENSQLVADSLNEIHDDVIKDAAEVAEPAITTEEVVKHLDEAMPPPEIVLPDSEEIDESAAAAETKTAKRSHLLDLYPEEAFSDNKADNEDDLKYIPLEMLYNDACDEEEDDDSDTDSTRKSIMVGVAYQASIPPGLSQYGDILPYENEDKLIWEPSQVSEREVEEFLSKVQEIKRSNMSEEELALAADEIEPNAKEDSEATKKHKPDTIKETQSDAKIFPRRGSESDQLSVVKDNEQALHLLVQCGYDFNEALRRKRLNALPLSSSMSSWSEDECQKFEEGIQKFGKDFLKIRQNLVRTRTMREMVHFYYLWKKSERRDQSFSKTETIDHMEVFLNESAGDFGTGGAQNGIGATGAVVCASNRKSTIKNFSIMTGGSESTSKSTTTTATTTTAAVTTTTEPVSSENNEYSLTNATVAL